jgi:hypothetical protein
VIGCVAVAGVAACAPATVSMSMPNPARAAMDVRGTQSYDIPPYAEDHRYEVTLERWSPAAVAFRIHLVNADSCGQPSHYSFDLVDDQGRRYPMVDARPIGAFSRRGHIGASISDTTIDASFAATIAPTTRYLILEVRPIADRACTTVNFRWTFEG